jgi:hypothetical protein
MKPNAVQPGKAGLEHYDELSRALTEDAAAIRVFVEGKGTK